MFTEYDHVIMKKAVIFLLHTEVQYDVIDRFIPQNSRPNVTLLPPQAEVTIRSDRLTGSGRDESSIDSFMKVPTDYKHLLPGKEIINCKTNGPAVYTTAKETLCRII